MRKLSQWQSGLWFVIVCLLWVEYTGRLTRSGAESGSGVSAAAGFRMWGEKWLEYLFCY